MHAGGDIDSNNDMSDIGMITYCEDFYQIRKDKALFLKLHNLREVQNKIGIHDRENKFQDFISLKVHFISLTVH